MKFFIQYPYVVYSVIALLYVLIVIGYKEALRLWLWFIAGGSILFVATIWLVGVGLYKINITFLPVLGIPFFYILWGALSGIIFAHHFGYTLLRRTTMILLFAGIVVGMEAVIEAYKRVEHLGKFNNLYEYVFDVVILTVLGFILSNARKKLP